MPIVNGKYQNPGWTDNARPPISAQNLNDISQTLEKLDAAGTGGVSSFNGRTGAVAPTAGDYTAAMVGAVPASRTVNGKPLSNNISLSASDVNAVPTTRTVNGKSLATDISLTATDVGATPITYGTSDLTPGTSTLATGSVYFVYE